MREDHTNPTQNIEYNEEPKDTRHFHDYGIFHF